MSLITKIFGDPNRRIIDSYKDIIDRINGLESRYAPLSDAELKGSAEALRDGVRTAQDTEAKLDEILPDAFALMREAAKRTLGLRHYDVQLVGGIVLHKGQIAEMRTGEGKTLVATLPLFLNALTGRGAHLVTVNDYLSRIGAGWNAPAYHLLGITTGVIVHDRAYIYDPEYFDESQYDERLKRLKPITRQEAYNCDILYGTNNEFGFDYLRDNMVPNLERMVQRGLYYSIVDEVDSILIDEARTPLIISAPAEESTDKYYKFAELVSRLKEDDDYNLDEKMRAATLTEGGITKMEKWLGVDNIYTSGGIREVHHIEQALKALVLFKNDRDYVVKDGEVIIVDEFTGRLMHGRRYSEGLHQAIEAKEGVKIQRESQTLATITFQNYFRIYKKLAGMTGTALTEAEEFSKIYNLETVSIPTHKPMIREDMNDLIYRSELGKYNAVARDIKARSEAGQPVLVGTISIEKNELLAELLEREGVATQVLNAKNHEKEAKIIAQAGKLGAVTIATNMAGRGVDIILGGNPPEPEEARKVRELGGLHVIGTERHEARRIDNQLRGRAGRQGDPGSSQFYLSPEDDLMRIFGGDRMKNLMKTLNVPENMPIENSLISKSIESAQKRVEGNNFDIRKHLVEYDDVINKHRESIYKRRRNILEIYEQQKKSAGINNNSQFPIRQLADNSQSNLNSEIINDTSRSLADIILSMVENEMEQFVIFHTESEYAKDWNLEEIYESVSTIFPANGRLKEDIVSIAASGDKLNKAIARTKLIEHIFGLAKEKYEAMKNAIEQHGFSWSDVEKEVLIRSIDTLWIEHLEAMDYMRKGIGLRGYGQRDPLVEYKKEAYRMFNELNNLIQKQVVYSIYKVADAQQFKAPTLIDRAKVYMAPAKEMQGRGSGMSAAAAGGENKDNQDKADIVTQKMRDDKGNKVGRNDPCPCGSGKKYKRCCGN